MKTVFLASLEKVFLFVLSAFVVLGAFISPAVVFASGDAGASGSSNSGSPFPQASEQNAREVGMKLADLIWAIFDRIAAVTQPLAPAMTAVGIFLLAFGLLGKALTGGGHGGGLLTQVIFFGLAMVLFANLHLIKQLVFAIFPW
ncbi:MAG: hypothetical protein KM296_00445 [Brockia lithotrophica]|nr:hypothetical protein [Brockia lithotrophica]